MVASTDNSRFIKFPPLRFDSFAAMRDGKASSENEMADCSKRGAIGQQSSKTNLFNGIACMCVFSNFQKELIISYISRQFGRVV